MAFTYTGNPAASLTDRVRFLLQDTSDPGLISDSEIAWMLSEESNNPYVTAAALCHVISRRYANQPGSRSIGDVSISYADLTDRYAKLAGMLQARAARKSSPLPYLGGLYKSDKEANDANDDHVDRHFDDGRSWSNSGSSRTGAGSGTAVTGSSDFVPTDFV